ncbi:MAG: penicillin-binding protein 2 [Candidatus Puniceispirillaceae bacterium]
MRRERKENKEQKTNISRRMLFVAGGQLLLSAVLVGRLYQIQINQSAAYQKLSDDNQFNERLMVAPRGRIYDRRGRILADNSEVFEVTMVPAHVDNIDKLLDKVGHIVRLTPQQRRDILEQVERQPDFLEVVIRSNLTQRELARLAVRASALPGTVFERRFRRIYPQGALLSHITGYVSPVTAREVSENRRLRRLPGLRTGKSGLERSFEASLRGREGQERIEVNARGKPVRMLTDRQAEMGDDLHLTIDIDLQNFITNRLQQGNARPVDLSSSEAQRGLMSNESLRAHIAAGDDKIFKDAKDNLIPPESGSVSVIDIRTGAVLAMVSLPSYDPNIFTDRLLQRDWSRVNTHPRNPLLNRSLSGLYSPGSTFKMVVMAAAMEAGVISPRTKIGCSGFFEFGDRNFYCWREGGHGALDGTQAVAQSCDVYFYQIALKTGINKIHEMARRFGLGEVSGLGIPGEKIGVMPNRDWKKARYGTSWTPGETVIAGIGQGFVLTTPIQLAVMTGRIATGQQISPTIIQSDDLDSRKFEPIPVSSDILREMRRGMRAVMQGGFGTARRYDLPDYQIAGKTGTVQVKRITQAQRDAGIIDNIDRPWKERDHALFVAYAPYKNPRYAISVVVEHGGSGSSMAAPVARDVFAYLLGREGV